MESNKDFFNIFKEGIKNELEICKNNIISQIEIYKNNLDKKTSNEYTKIANYFRDI